MSDIKVVITGMGIISGIGNNVKETLESILAQKSGLTRVKYLKTIHNQLPVSEVKCSDEEMWKMVGLTDGTGYSRTALFGMISAREALESAGIKNVNDVRTGLISGTTVGGMEKSELYYSDFLTNDSKNQFIETHDCGESTERIADFLGIKDFVSTVSTACSSSANSVVLGARMIKAGLLDRVIAGGSECITKYHVNGFNTLMILDKNACRPFDATRAGLNLGEGAAFLVLESEELAKANNRNIICEIKGYGNACDAYHQTASSPDGQGAFLAMKKALDMSGLAANEINYINAHGTATSNNDISEGIAIQRLFGENIPPISSTKPYTAHTTSAAGGVEAVIALLAIKNGLLIPNLNFSTKMEEISFEPITKLQQGVEIKNVLSNSFGFGGNNSSVIFSKY